MLADANQPGYQTFGPDPGYDNYQPAVEAQSSSGELYAAASLPSSNTIHVVHLTGTPPAASFSSTDTYLVSQLTTPPNAVQRGSGMSVDTGDDRISSAVLLGGVLYVSANDACSDPNGSITACGRVMEIDTNQNNLIGEADLGVNGGDWYYLALAPDTSGNLLAVFDYSSPTDYPGMGAIAAIGPVVGENGGNFTNWMSLATGTAPNNSGRAGDYSGAAIDWSNPRDVWVGSEVGDSLGVDFGQWGSHVDSISLTPGALPTEAAHQVWNPGGAYSGSTRQGYRIRIQTGGGGGRIEKISLSGAVLTCHDGYRNRFGSTIIPAPGATLNTNGHYTATQTFRPDNFSHWTTTTISGTLTNNTISGTFKQAESSRHHGICRTGTVSYSAR